MTIHKTRYVADGRFVDVALSLGFAHAPGLSSRRSAIFKL